MNPLDELVAKFRAIQDEATAAGINTLVVIAERDQPIIQFDGSEIEVIGMATLAKETLLRDAVARFERL